MNTILKMMLVPAGLALAASAHAAPANLGDGAAKMETARGIAVETAQYNWRDRDRWERRHWRHYNRHHYRYHAPQRCFWSRYYGRRVCTY
jgi:hypothetical protein